MSDRPYKNQHKSSVKILIIRKHGFLLKKSPVLQQWRKRYMVLEGIHPSIWYLYSYKDKESASQSHKYIKGNRISAINDDEKGGDNKENAFPLSKPTEIIDVRSYKSIKVIYRKELKFEMIASLLTSRQFKAYTPHELDQWVKVLGQFCQYALFSPHRVKTLRCEHIATINIISPIQKYNSHFVSEVRCDLTVAVIHFKVMNHFETIGINDREFGIRAINNAIGVHSMTKIGNAYNSSTHILNVFIYFKPYKHLVTSVPITCPHMKKSNTTNPLQCPVYYGMKENYEWNQKHLDHIDNFTHFADEYGEKPECKFKEQCYSYSRLENGGNALSDRCHVKLFRHPPRSRRIKLAENIHSLIINDCEDENYPLYMPTNDDRKQYKFNETDGYLSALIEEVIKNGFESDLHLPDDDTKDSYTLLQIADAKLKAKRHELMSSPLNRAEMLSLILYTGCDCNYDLCSSQRNGNYLKWKWFDYCLWNAIYKLSEQETGSFNVYSGLNQVKLNKKSIRNGFFVTYVSTSWRKEVAESFMTGDGMMIQINKEFMNNGNVICCDVSWISKFPDESEILFVRSVYKDGWDGFKCKVLDEADGVQTISLSKK